MHPDELKSEDLTRLVGLRVGDATVNDLGKMMLQLIHMAQKRVGPGEAGRWFALSKTALEEALTRYNGGRYHEMGTFHRADPDA